MYSKIEEDPDLLYLVNSNRVKEEDCDDIIRQYSYFIDDIVQALHAEFVNFDPVQDRVDTFLYEHTYVQGQRAQTSVETLPPTPHNITRASLIRA